MTGCYFQHPCFQSITTLHFTQHTFSQGHLLISNHASTQRTSAGTHHWFPRRKPLTFACFYPRTKLFPAVNYISQVFPSFRASGAPNISTCIVPCVVCCLHQRDPGNDASTDFDACIKNDVTEGFDLGMTTERRRRKEQLQEELFLASQRLKLRQDREILRIKAHRPIWTYVVSFRFCRLVLLTIMCTCLSFRLVSDPNGILAVSR